jgi:signal transduction histidine kinase
MPVQEPITPDLVLPEAPPRTATAADERTSAIRVWHVEDDDQIVRVVARIFQPPGGSGIEIIRYAYLRDVLAALPQSRPGDVLLLDLNLPDNKGWSTFEQIHQARPELPLVILTGDPDEELARRAVRQGAQDYLLKSEISLPGLLMRVVRYALDRRIYLREIEEGHRLLEAQNLRLLKALKNLEKTSAALIESEKIKSLGQMAAGIAHEVKNPLAILRMGLDYLNRAKPEKAAAALQKTIPDLFAALSRADSIIADMMDYSAPRSIHPELMSLNRLVEEAAAIMKPLCARNRVDIILDLAPALPELSLDRQKIIQLLLNLIGNAVQAMARGGGKLLIHTATTMMEGEISDESGKEDLPDPVLVVVEIHDSGPGIPPEILPRVFDPFFTTKSASGGTGLGLSVCAMIMDLHGGRLELMNHPDGGALARLTFIV